MSDSGKKPFKDRMADIDGGLADVFAALGAAVSEIQDRLTQDDAVTAERRQGFETSRGTVKAAARFNLRMGGIDINLQTAPDDHDPSDLDEAQPPAQALDYDLWADGTDWSLTADMPGVAPAELALAQAGTVLKITTHGARRYASDIDIGVAFDLAKLSHGLENGVLTIKSPEGTDQ